jgi:large subunit ribosomal protein L11
MSEDKKLRIRDTIKFFVTAGKATPAPPVGSSLGQKKVNTKLFIEQFNSMTGHLPPVLIPVKVIVFEDGSFEIKYRNQITSELIKQAAGIKLGSGTKQVIASITRKQLNDIAKIKLGDNNCYDIEACEKTVIATAKSMGVEVKDV